jgi:ADP-ribosyl-[dinitrogen reductase] hydrolase
MRTSLTHPLQIAAVRPQPGFGQIGITFCPGKKQPSAMTGGWDRDLGLDLDAVRDFSAAALLTLLEPHEMRLLGVEALGEQTALRHIDWLHLPIRDGSVPGHEFEQAWQTVGPGLRARLRAGFNIVIHCKGGLGRAGMIAARLLVELGYEPDKAIRAVRKVRPGAIETAAQEAYVRHQSPVVEAIPHQHEEAIRDRGVGALLGLAVGDAVGTTLEFRERDSYPLHVDMTGGGPFRLEAGQWTDDTAMALALADSLCAAPEFDPEDLMRRFVDWRDRGEYSCTGRCFDIGITTNAALNRWQQTGDPYAGATAPNTAGNGSLMRLAPVAIRFWRDREALRRIAALQSRTTHAAPEAVSACVAYAEVLADAIAGMPRDAVLAPRDGDYAGAIGAIMAGSWRGKARDQIASSGYVAHSLEAALWSVARTSDFRSAVLLAANLGGDADTTAAIAGQLAGALYGASAIPPEWLDKLAWRPRIEGMARALLAGSERSTETSR